MAVARGYQGPIPATGHYFDRVDVEGELHSRTYFRDRERYLDAMAIPDPDRPGRWKVLIRWHRRGQWHNHGWGPVSESEALVLIDAVAIGVEAATSGATYLGNLPA